MIAIIRLALKFLLFFQKFYFYLSIWTIKLAFRYICTITIYDSSSTLWQRQDSAFLQILGLLTEEVDGINFQVVLIVELFLTKMVRKRVEQMIIRWSQVRKIKWMRNGNPSWLQEFFTGRLCNMRSRLLMQIGNSILLALEVFSNPIQLLTVEIGGHGATTWKNFPVNNTIDFSSNAQHRFRWTLRRCPVCFTSA